MGIVGVLLLIITGVAGVTHSPFINFTSTSSMAHMPRIHFIVANEFLKLHRKELTVITPYVFNVLVGRNQNLFTGPFQSPNSHKLKIPVTVPSGLFSNMTHLKIVILSECNLLSLPNDVFSGSYNIKSLYLNRNYFKRFEEETFFDLEDLEVLDLSKNGIFYLPEKLFYKTKRLKTLKMQYNTLVEIKQRLFLHLSELEYLDLRFNRIQEIQGEQFFGLKSLRFLNISDNQLSSLALTTQLGDSGNYSVLQHCTNLEDLQLANNSLTEVYVDWKMALHRLRTLNLAFNNIQTVEIFIFDSDTTEDHSNCMIKLPDTKFVSPLFFRSINFDNNPFVCDFRLFHFVQFIYKRKFFYTRENLKCKEPKALENQTLISLPLTSLTCRLFNNSEYNCPEHCTCKYRPIDKANIVNCTRAGLQQVPQLLSRYRLANHTELNLDYNRLTSFSIPRNRGYENVTHFHLSNNNIKSLEISGFSKNIKVLDMSHNNLTGLTSEVTLFLEHSPDLNLLMLHDNHWLCDCDILPLLRLLRKKSKAVKLSQNITCPNNTSLETFLDTELCPGSENIMAIICIVLTILSLLIAFFNALYYQFRTQIHIYCFSSKWKVLHWMVSHPDIDVDKKYDAFISYANEDEPFILEHLIPELEENGERIFKLCLHFRDWKGGDSIPSQILYSVQNSRRTIVVLSPSFLKSVWGIVEFRTAHSEALKTGTSKVIVILKEEVGDITELEAELKAYLQMNTYIKWGSPWFWQQLKFALPHPPEDQDDIKCFFGCFPKVSKDTRSHNVLQNVCLKNGEVTYVTEMSEEKNSKDLNHSLSSDPHL